MERMAELLMYGLPAGFIGAVFSWIFGKRKRDNDMLSQLQASIDLLSAENKKILAENVQLRKENAGLKANQEELKHLLIKLAREVDKLKGIIKQTENGKEKTLDSICAALHRIGITTNGLPDKRNGNENRTHDIVLPERHIRSGNKEKDGNDTGGDDTQENGIYIRNTGGYIDGYIADTGDSATSGRSAIPDT